MSLTARKINNIKASDKEQWEPLGGGCYLVVPKSKGARKRFVGKTRINSLSGKLYSVPLGFWGEDFKKPQEVLKKWEEMKLWGKSNNADLRRYGQRIELVQSQKTLREVVDLFIQHKSHLQKN